MEPASREKRLQQKKSRTHIMYFRKIAHQQNTLSRLRATACLYYPLVATRQGIMEAADC